jgi:hypothetical protein
MKTSVDCATLTIPAAASCHRFIPSRFEFIARFRGCRFLENAAGRFVTVALARVPQINGN